MRAGLLLAFVGGACGGSSEAAPTLDATPQVPTVGVTPVAAADLCVTKGATGSTIGALVDDASFRGVAPGSSGEAAALTFTYGGATDAASALANGKVRRQLGVKLRAENGCNVVYVMWRLDPKPKLEVSVKRNPGALDHEDCGAEGYTKVKPARSTPVPHLSPRSQHTLRAELRGQELIAWIDGKQAWRGTLPAAAKDLAGPAGLRSDNLIFTLDAFAAPAGSSSERAIGSAANAKCVTDPA